MTDEQLTELDVPACCFEQATATIDAIREHNDTGGQYDIEEIVGHVTDDPLYFVMEGGSDGTSGHAKYRAEYGPIHKSLIDLAAMVAGSKGMDY